MLPWWYSSLSFFVKAKKKKGATENCRKGFPAPKIIICNIKEWSQNKQSDSNLFSHPFGTITTVPGRQLSVLPAFLYCDIESHFPRQQRWDVTLKHGNNFLSNSWQQDKVEADKLFHTGPDILAGEWKCPEGGWGGAALGGRCSASLLLQRSDAFIR